MQHEDKHSPFSFNRLHLFFPAILNLDIKSEKIRDLKANELRENYFKFMNEFMNERKNLNF